MRPARAVLEELVRHVQPPKGCAIVFTERPLNKSDDPNWIVMVGPMGAQYTKRYTEKVAQLRKSDLGLTGLRSNLWMGTIASRFSSPTSHPRNPTSFFLDCCSTETSAYRPYCPPAIWLGAGDGA
jgi:hypothetical protein